MSSAHNPTIVCQHSHCPIAFNGRDADTELAGYLKTAIWTFVRDVDATTGGHRQWVNMIGVACILLHSRKMTWHEQFILLYNKKNSGDVGVGLQKDNIRLDLIKEDPPVCWRLTCRIHLLP